MKFVCIIVLMFLTLSYAYYCRYKEEYYRALEIKVDATSKEIKESARILSRKYHPDKNQNKGASEQFQRIREAYQVLSNPRLKKVYDETVEVVCEPRSFYAKIVDIFKQMVKPLEKQQAEQNYIRQKSSANTVELMNAVAVLIIFVMMLLMMLLIMLHAFGFVTYIMMNTIFAFLLVFLFFSE